MQNDPHRCMGFVPPVLRYYTIQTANQLTWSQDKSSENGHPNLDMTWWFLYHLRKINEELNLAWGVCIQNL